MNTIASLRPVFVGIFTFFTLFASAQKLTSVRGQVTDARTGEGLANATVRFDSLGKGVVADLDGKFFITSKLAVKSIRASYIGYKTKIYKIKTGEVNEVSIRLEEASNELEGVEITAKAKKYRNRNNKSVDLIKEMIDHKEMNRKEHFDYFGYQKYEKVGFAFNGVTDRMRHSLLFKKTQFIFENADTNTTTGKINLPFFLREALSDVYYRKSPSEQKEYIRAERTTTIPGYLDEEGLSNNIQNLYREVDFYQNAVNLVTMDFVSPLAPVAPTIYQFFTLDTVLIGNDSCAHISFKPRQSQDLAFIGELWVSIDSTYALRKIEARIPEGINLNWVTDLQVEQSYDWITTSDGKRGLVLTRDEIVMDYGISKRNAAQTVLAHKTTLRQNYTLNQPYPDSLFRTSANVFKDPRATLRPKEYWEKNRPDTLDTHEQGVYKMLDSLNGHAPFIRFMNTLKLLVDGYVSPGGVDIGPLSNFASFNGIEGFRPRFGGRTNLKFSKKLMLGGYLAYGLKDERFKGMAELRYSMGKDPVRQYPLNQFRVWYHDDLSVPGQQTQNALLLSFQRGSNNRMLYFKTLGAEYLREYKAGFSYAFSFKNTHYAPAGVLDFKYLNSDGGTEQRSDILTSEAGISLRYAPNEQFYQAPDARLPLLNKYPTFNLWYTIGLKEVMGGQYSYHSIQFRAKKAFYLSPIGWSVAFAEAGRIFGQVPYPLLTVHRANQSYSYQTESYNLMNFLEFASDHYASVNITHYFGGFFLNRVPLLKRLKLREVVTFKGIWGGLDERSRPSAANGLLQFPTDDQGRTITYTLERAPYMEASVGILNIFHFLRIDYVRRFNYLNHPGVSPNGVRARIQVEF